jgi:hypothetical protein
MGDWTANVGILIVAVLWIQIFMDYRRKLLRLMPTVSTVSNSARGDHEHLVHISAFYMDKTEVTNLQYRNLSLSPVTQSLVL